MENFKIEKFIDRPDFYRSNDEKMCYDLLDELSISYERYVYDHYPVDDKEMMILDSYIEVKAIKILIYRSQNKSDFYLIILPKAITFDKKRFKEAMHLKKIRRKRIRTIRQRLPLPRNPMRKPAPRPIP